MHINANKRYLILLCQPFQFGVFHEGLFVGVHQIDIKTDELEPNVTLKDENKQSTLPAANMNVTIRISNKPTCVNLCGTFNKTYKNHGTMSRISNQAR